MGWRGEGSVGHGSVLPLQGCFFFCAGTQVEHYCAVSGLKLGAFVSVCAGLRWGWLKVSSYV